MDQASSLRELMKKVKHPEKLQSEALPIAFIAGEGVGDCYSLMERIALYQTKENEMKSAYFHPVNEKNDAIELYLEDFCSLESTHSNPSLNLNCWRILGSLEVLAKARYEKYKADKLKLLIQETEKERDLIMYRAGDGIGSLTINLAKMASKVVFVLKPTQKGILEFASYLRVFSKVAKHLELGIIMDTSNNDLFQKQWGYLQEINNQEFNYKIEAIGCFDLNYIHLFDEVEVCKAFSMDFFIHQNTKKKLSDSIAQIF